MGNYIQASDLTPQRIPKLKLLQLVDDDKQGFDGSGNFQAAHLAIINALITEAELEAEGYAGKRYQITALRTAQPESLRVKIRDLAEVKLFARRPPLIEGHIDLRNQALAWLKSLQTGEDVFGLDAPPAQKTGPQGGNVATVDGPCPQMDHRSLEGF